jgi:serine/threonine protein kinase
MPHLSRTASAELHGRAIRRLRQLGRGELVMPSNWVLPNDSIPMPEWCEPHPHQQYLIEEDVWLCDYQPRAGHPLMKVVVKGCGGEYALPQRLAEVSSSFSSFSRYIRAEMQARFAESIVTKSLIHPNIVTFLGILQNWTCWSSLSSYRLPIKYELALVSEYLPFSSVLAYLERVPSETTACRIGLVSDECSLSLVCSLPSLPIRFVICGRLSHICMSEA